MTVRSLVLLLLAWSLMALCGPGLSMAATATSTEMVGHTYDVPAVHHDSAVMTASRARSGRENGHHTGHAEWKPNPQNPTGFDQVKRVDTQHANPHSHGGVPTPHTHSGGGVRPATPDELPK